MTALTPRMMLTVRAAQADDTEMLAALDARCNPHPWPPQHFQAALNSPHSTVLLAQQDDVLQGFIVWQQVLDEIELHLIATAPEYRRQGIAAQLLHQMFQAATTNAVARIFLEVRAGNVAAQQLYLRHGFVQTAVRRNYYDSEDAVLMEKIC